MERLNGLDCNYRFHFWVEIFEGVVVVDGMFIAGWCSVQLSLERGLGLGRGVAVSSPHACRVGASISRRQTRQSS